MNRTLAHRKWKSHAPYSAGRVLSTTIQTEAGHYVGNVRLWGVPPEHLQRRLDLILAAPELLDMLGQLLDPLADQLIDPAQQAADRTAMRSLYHRLKENH